MNGPCSAALPETALPELCAARYLIYRVLSRALQSNEGLGTGLSASKRPMLEIVAEEPQSQCSLGF